MTVLVILLSLLLIASAWITMLFSIELRYRRRQLSWYGQRERLMSNCWAQAMTRDLDAFDRTVQTLLAWDDAHPMPRAPSYRFRPAFLD